MLSATSEPVGKRSTFILDIQFVWQTLFQFFQYTAFTSIMCFIIPKLNI